MTPSEIQVKINIAQKEADFWRSKLANKACETCLHWMHRGCGQAEGAEPPPEVVRAGCDDWSWDQIPF